MRSIQEKISLHSILEFLINKPITSDNQKIINIINKINENDETIYNGCKIIVKSQKNDFNDITKENLIKIFTLICNIIDEFNTKDNIIISEFNYYHSSCDTFKVKSPKSKNYGNMIGWLSYKERKDSLEYSSWNDESSTYYEKLSDIIQSIQSELKIK